MMNIQHWKDQRTCVAVVCVKARHTLTSLWPWAQAEVQHGGAPHPEQAACDSPHLRQSCTAEEPHRVHGPARGLCSPGW